MLAGAGALLAFVAGCGARSGEDDVNASAWDRKWWRGTLPTIGSTPQGIGILQWDVGSSSVDVMVDFGDSNIALPVNATGHGILLAIYTYSGNLKTFRTSYTFSPSGGVEESHISAQDGQGTITQDGNVFIVQASGNMADGWGVQAIAANAGPAPNGVTGLYICGIAHGVEVAAAP
jgi:hypothetical protein